MKTLNSLLTTLAIIPRNSALYEQAFTHPSLANEKRIASYQRMEFFGDALIEKSVTEYIYRNMPRLDEGQMTSLRAMAVAGSTLATHARQIGLAPFIRFGNKSEGLGDNDRVLADVFEALAAAIYLDLGTDVLERFLATNVHQFVRETKNKETKNPKTILQEYLQSESRETIAYEVSALTLGGFEALVRHDGNVFGRGRGQTKKEAEVAAAENALALLKTTK